jgi:DNA polymerase III sliding clamp (beta) subunit (PCNA family)
MRQALLDLRLLKGAALCASTESTRFYLQGVLIELYANGDAIYVATDGHRLFAARKENRDKGEDINPPLVGSFIVPSVVCNSIKIKPRDPLPLGILAQLADAEFKLTPLHENGITFKMVDGTFPDWRRVLPHKPEKPNEEITYNWNYLTDFFKIGRIINSRSKSHPVLVRNGEGAAWVRWGVNAFDDGIECFGIVMPMRGFDASGPAPEWTKAPAPFVPSAVA